MAVDPFRSKFTENKGKDAGKKPWDFGAPNERNRSAGYTNVGDAYGTGYRQPVGKMRATGLKDGLIPQKSDRINPLSLA